MNQNVETYFESGCGRCALGGTPECKVHRWEKELALLRDLILETGLTEECKWGVPCYTYQNANVVILSALKECVTIGYFKGALLADPEGILEKPGDNTQAARVIKFTSLQQIKEQASTFKAYLFEAMEIEKAGLKVEVKKTAEPIPAELEQAFKKNRALKDAFDALTPGRQRGYLLHFAQPKQSKTREARIEKWTAQIMKGKGMYD